MDKRTTGANDLQLEKIALGEASPAGPLSPADEARLQALRDDNAQILARYPAGPQAEQIAARVAAAKRSEAPRRAPRWVLLPGLAGAATLVAVLWLARPPSVVPSDPDTAGGPDVITTKGGAPSGAAQVLLYRKRDGRAEPLSDRAEASPGDLLQLAYVPGRARYGVLLSVDGRGGVTVHYPTDNRETPSLFPGPVMPPKTSAAVLVTREIRLPQAFRLDDAPGFERFFLITAEEAQADSLKLSEIVAAARRLAADPARAEHEPGLPGLPTQLGQRSLTLSKPRGSR